MERKKERNVGATQKATQATWRRPYWDRRWGANPKMVANMVQREVKAPSVHQAGRKVVNEGNGWFRIDATRSKPNLDKGYQRTAINAKYGDNERKKLFLSEENEKAYAKAFNERRCLRCLAKDHKRAQCREPMRCFKCGKLGHYSGRCNQTNKKTDIKEKVQLEVPKEDRLSNKNLTYAQILKEGVEKGNGKGKQKIEPFWDERPEQINVYLPHREQLTPGMEYLNRTGMVVMVEGAAEPGFEQIIAQCISNRRGWMPQDYSVLPGDLHEVAPYLVICPGEQALRNAVWNSPYTIRPGVQVGIIPWDPTWNTQYDPAPYQAWIRLVGLPLQAWNTADIKEVTSSLGRLTGILPYGRQAGNFYHITCRIACDHPRKIPKTAKYHERHKATIVRVVLLHWRDWEEGHYPLPPDAWGNDQQVNQVIVASDTPSSTIDEGGSGRSRSGGSNSMTGGQQGPAPMVGAVRQWQRVRKVRPKVKQVWIPKKKVEIQTISTRKATQEGAIQTAYRFTVAIEDRGNVQVIVQESTIRKILRVLHQAPKLVAQLSCFIKCMEYDTGKGWTGCNGLSEKRDTMHGERGDLQKRTKERQGVTEITVKRKEDWVRAINDLLGLEAWEAWQKEKKERGRIQNIVCQ